jgi:RNA polymerase sigma-70 factor (ECF subfamily)
VDEQTLVKSERTDNEHELVLRCQQGDERAMRLLYERYADRVFTMALRLTGRVTDAEDVVQDTFFRAWRSIGRFRGEASFKTWLYKIGSHLCYDQYKRSQRMDIKQPPEEEAGAALQGSDPIVRKRLARALKQLPEGCRRVLVLHDVMELTHTEISYILEINDGTSKSQLYKARVRMRKLLAASGSTLRFWGR